MPTTVYGTQVYQADHERTLARGVLFTQAELVSLLNGPVKSVVQDPEGKEGIRMLLASVATTGFEQAALEEMLADETAVPSWLIGEAIAEVFVTGAHQCEFPWPSGRDLKNPNASPTGADLVGFQLTDDAECPYRFAFGEVKTSVEQKWPPQVAYGRAGLQQQLEDLRDSKEVKAALFRYLGFHASNTPWADKFRSAAKRYLQSNYEDAVLFGLLIRDVEPKANDLRKRAVNLSSNQPPATAILIYALYLPNQMIEKLPALLGNGDHESAS